MPECTCRRCGERRKHESRGLCDPCYQWAKRHDALALYPKIIDRHSIDEWIALIDTGDPDACWLWPGPAGTRGYGGATGGAHRAVYKRMVGPIPDGYQIGHTCHDRSGCAGGNACPHRMCVNWVQHLKPMTCIDNLLATPNTFNAINVAKDHCPQDHPYDQANTAYRNGRRHCKACARDRRRRNYYANLEIERMHAREYQRRRRTAPVAPDGAKVVPA